MKKISYRHQAIIVVILMGVTFFSIRLFHVLTRSVQVEVVDGEAGGVPMATTTPDAKAMKSVAESLLAAGLNKVPLLGDTGVPGHIERLKQGETSVDELQQYARNLVQLNRYTMQHHGPIPTSFWDVRTPAMEDHHWTEYGIVHQLTQPEWEPYLRLLTRGYGRFLTFKAKEGDDTAVDAALDMFSYVEDYYHSVPPSILIEHAKEIQGEAEAVLMIWQSLVAGTTRINPLTHKPMFSHSIFTRDNVGTMYQYDQGRAMSIGAVWGVSGFAPHFVGIVDNNNQVEHMSISMVLQIVLQEPVLILDGIEEEKLLTGQASEAMSFADMALNNILHKEFVPYFTQDRLVAVERLRRALKKQ